MSPQNIGKKLKEARLKLNFTQANVAKKAGLTVTYYAMIERDEVNPSYEKLKSIVDVLKMKITIS